MSNTVKWTPIRLLRIRKRSVKNRQPIAMSLDQLVHQRPNLVKVEFGGGVRIEHGSMINMFAFARECGFNDKRLHIDIRLLKRGKLWRHHTDLGGLESALINEAGYFDTTTLRQVIDESVVGDVAINIDSTPEPCKLT